MIIYTALLYIIPAIVVVTTIVTGYVSLKHYVEEMVKG